MKRGNGESNIYIISYIFSSAFPGKSLWILMKEGSLYVQNEHNLNVCFHIDNTCTSYKPAIKIGHCRN